MPVEFIGIIGTQHQSGNPPRPGSGGLIDDYVERIAIAHDEGGFDRAPWSAFRPGPRL